MSAEVKEDMGTKASRGTEQRGRENRQRRSALQINKEGWAKQVLSGSDSPPPGGGVSSLVECWPTMCKALDLIPSIVKINEQI